MARSEYDANAGLKEGRRVNPGLAKVPPQTYMSVGDALMVMGALVAGCAVIAYAGEITEGLWNLWKFASDVATSAGR
jgi:hypothetical protein